MSAEAGEGRDSKQIGRILNHIEVLHPLATPAERGQFANRIACPRKVYRLAFRDQSPGLPEPNEACYFPRMSTLSEIEAAVDQLSHPEQEILLEHLAQKLGARPPAMEGSRAQRERWLQKLDGLRNRGSTGKTGVPLQEILDDIRAERC